MAQLFNTAPVLCHCTSNSNDHKPACETLALSISPESYSGATYCWETNRCRLDVVHLANQASPDTEIPGVRCPTCLGSGKEVWVLPGRTCGVCGTACDSEFQLFDWIFSLYSRIL
ncbi:hypothetical protein B0T10DRAFT_456389 [Thelonectria olida]|uniref:Uncharacterized protein n=1 Tax=Thelonectria olida TaxID=1576542 RepID=A0A9P8WCB0_9HYPO|nr:hypothetical protein B0T10DRAFT_456389 [Thelonectria olida]